MDLRVEITGLCLFVPNRSERKVHVLMPKSGHMSGGTHVHPHTVTLKYQGSDPKLEDMGGWFLDLSRLGGKGSKSDVPRPALHIGERVERWVDGRQWSQDARDSVVSHFTLPRQNEEELGRTVQWRVVTQNPDGSTSTSREQLTHHLTLVMKDIDPGLFRTWKRHPLRPGGGATPQQLPEPVPSGNVYTLEIKHLPPPAHDHPLERDEEATHFQAYHDVFERAPQKRVRVFLDQDPDPTVGGSPFNCMLAQSGREA